jgi:spermidine synthase
MLPWETIEKATTPDGAALNLVRRGSEWVVRADGRVLMSSAVHGSEERLAELALAQVPAAKTVLLGGLGLGFTLRATLDLLGPEGRVIVVELSRALVDWNRTHVAGLAGRPLDDPRVRLQLGDVFPRLAESKGVYDAILLDVDNGPSAVAHAQNELLYGDGGIAVCLAALRVGGVLAVWSAGPDERYLKRLQRAKFEAQAKTVTARAEGGVRHTIFLAVKPALRHRHSAQGQGQRTPKRR